MSESAILAMENGSIFHGISVGVTGKVVGEVVFNTAMSGYQEILTDPSYARQLVCLTASHVGNVGINARDMESDRVYAAGLIARQITESPSSWRSERSLPDFLRAQNVVAISELDTRRLTRMLRDEGALNACLMAGSVSPDEALAEARRFPGLLGMDLARDVTTARAYSWNEGTWPSSRPSSAGRFHVVVYDFGVKRNILRLLVDVGCQVTVVPALTPFREVLSLNPSGIVLSNGPGDPAATPYGIACAREILESGTPVFGICLGHQLIALASGARTVKTKFGHHGANHPIQDLSTGQVFITSQNHGFAVDQDTLPSNVKASHRSLFDGTLQGLVRTDVPAMGLQGHPEASPGPHDIRHLFARFTELMKQ